MSSRERRYIRTTLTAYSSFGGKKRFVRGGGGRGARQEGGRDAAFELFSAYRPTHLTNRGRFTGRKPCLASPRLRRPAFIYSHDDNTIYHPSATTRRQDSACVTDETLLDDYLAREYATLFTEMTKHYEYNVDMTNTTLTKNTNNREINRSSFRPSSLTLSLSSRVQHRREFIQVVFDFACTLYAMYTVRTTLCTQRSVDTRTARRKRTVE